MKKYFSTKSDDDLFHIPHHAVDYVRYSDEGTVHIHTKGKLEVILYSVEEIVRFDDWWEYWSTGGN